MLIMPNDLLHKVTRWLKYVDDETCLDNAWDAWRDSGRSEESFTTFASEHAERPIIVVNNYAFFTYQCDRCEESFYEDMNAVDDETLCDDCFAEVGGSCDHCGDNVYRETTTYIESRGYDVCRFCLENYYSWCEECGEYFTDSSEHRHTCECEAPHLDFTFPANGHGTVEADERITIALPQGTIDAVGLERIISLIRNETEDWHSARKIVDDIGDQWQTKRGNFTRRLSSSFYKATSRKLPTETISEVGNLARAHSSGEASWHVEVTRNLNLPAEDFWHEDSCWWGGYAESRCALKSWGGLGLRSFHGPDSQHGVSGRAWVQPLGKDLKPIHDTMGAHAYIVYNGYGELENYVPARIVAYMAGKTYKKVSLSASPQYVNNGIGYLVADEATCASTDGVDYYATCASTDGVDYYYDCHTHAPFKDQSTAHHNHQGSN